MNLLNFILEKIIQTMEKIRWGILGCGRIASKFSEDLLLVENAVLEAVASRDVQRAKSLAEKNKIKKYYSNYEELASDPHIDIIYIATPHGLHYEHAMLCLDHGKAVLCEKAFALNSKQAEAMVEKARVQNIFLMEALWSKFLPHYRLLMHYIKDGRMGTLQNVLINFGFAVGNDPVSRIYEPTLGGGSLLDIGIYNVFFALSALGEPDEIQAWMTPAPTGVDAQCAVTFRYNNGSFAQLFSSFTSHLPTEAVFSGTGGSVRLSTRFYEPSTTFEYYPDKMQSKEIIPFERTAGWGYHYEIRHVNECLLQGRKESPVMRTEDTLLLMRVMDRIRKKAGIIYAADGNL